MTNVRTLGYQMKRNTLLILALLPFSWGCASFNHGDILVERSAAKAMLQDPAIRPFSEIKVSWENFPYRSATDSIGEASISNPRKIKPVPVPSEDEADFTREAREIFSKAGLYDPQKGTGTLDLGLTTLGRWTYRELMGSYFVDTGFIFLIPSSISVNYYLAADFSVSTGPVRVETIATNKTTFHILLAPLWPFTSPGRREAQLLKQMLWRSATDVYARLKAGGWPAPGARQEQTEPPKPAAREQDPNSAPVPQPPTAPSRDWKQEPPDD